MSGKIVFVDGGRLANAFEGLGLFRPIVVKKLLNGILEGNDIVEIRIYVSLPPESVYPARRSDVQAWAHANAADGATVLICEQLAVRSVLLDHPMTLELTVDLVAFARGAASELVLISNDLALVPAIRVARQQGATIASAYFEYGADAPSLESYSSRHQTIALDKLLNFTASDG